MYQVILIKTYQAHSRQQDDISPLNFGRPAITAITQLTLSPATIWDKRQSTVNVQARQLRQHRSSQEDSVRAVSSLCEVLAICAAFRFEFRPWNCSTQPQTGGIIRNLAFADTIGKEHALKRDEIVVGTWVN